MGIGEIWVLTGRMGWRNSSHRTTDLTAIKASWSYLCSHFIYQDQKFYLSPDRKYFTNQKWSLVGILSACKIVLRYLSQLYSEYAVVPFCKMICKKCFAVCSVVWCSSVEQGSKKGSEDRQHFNITFGSEWVKGYMNSLDHILQRKRLKRWVTCT